MNSSAALNHSGRACPHDLLIAIVAALLVLAAGRGEGLWQALLNKPGGRGDAQGNDSEQQGNGAGEPEHSANDAGKSERSADQGNPAEHSAVSADKQHAEQSTIAGNEGDCCSQLTGGVCNGEDVDSSCYGVKLGESFIGANCGEELETSSFNDTDTAFVEDIEVSVIVDGSLITLEDALLAESHNANVIFSYDLKRSEDEPCKCKESVNIMLTDEQMQSIKAEWDVNEHCYFNNVTIIPNVSYKMQKLTDLQKQSPEIIDTEYELNQILRVDEDSAMIINTLPLCGVNNIHINIKDKSIFSILSRPIQSFTGIRDIFLDNKRRYSHSIVLYCY